MADIQKQVIVEAVPGIRVSVIDYEFAGYVDENVAESAILRTLPNGKEEVIGIQHHGRHREGKRRKSNRDIAFGIAKSIRAREARKGSR